MAQLRQNLPLRDFFCRGCFYVYSSAFLVLTSRVLSALCLDVCCPGWTGACVCQHKPPSQQLGQPWHVATPLKPPYAASFLSTQSTKDSSLLGATALSSKDLRTSYLSLGHLEYDISTS